MKAQVDQENSVSKLGPATEASTMCSQRFVSSGCNPLSRGPKPFSPSQETR